jgi:hypothetical protein
MLILCEKPSVARDFAEALGCGGKNGYYQNEIVTVTYCVGHLFELAKPEHYHPYNIDNLTDKAYRFLKYSIGFIAHYDRFGFMRCYREPGSLKQDILDFQYQNQWGNFRPGERGYEYYMQQKNIYNKICHCLKHNVEYHPHPRQNVEKSMEFDFGR